MSICRMCITRTELIYVILRSLELFRALGVPQKYYTECQLWFVYATERKKLHAVKIMDINIQQLLLFKRHFDELAMIISLLLSYLYKVTLIIEFRSPLFWDITPCSPLRVSRRSGVICRLHLSE
jgi:hypothetical protein